MKKFVFIIALLLFVTGCIETPDISINDIRLDGIVQGDIRIKIMVDIHNPNNFSVTLKSVDYKMFFEEVPCGDGNWEGEEELEGHSTKTLPFLLSVDKDMLMKVFAAFLKGKSEKIQSKISLEVKAVLKKFGKTFNYTYTWSFKDKSIDKKTGSKHKETPEKTSKEKPSLDKEEVNTESDTH